MESPKREDNQLRGCVFIPRVFFSTLCLQCSWLTTGSSMSAVRDGKGMRPLRQALTKVVTQENLIATVMADKALAATVASAR